jgi:hypothetical protein
MLEHGLGCNLEDNGVRSVDLGGGRVLEEKKRELKK